MCICVCLRHRNIIRLEASQDMVSSHICTWSVPSGFLRAALASTQLLRVCVLSCVQLFRAPWNFPGKNTGVGCRALLQRIFPPQGSNLHLLHRQAGSLLVQPEKSKTGFRTANQGAKIILDIFLSSSWDQIVYLGYFSIYVYRKSISNALCFLLKRNMVHLWLKYIM